MSNKTCEECSHFDGRYNLCTVTSDFCTVEPNNSACDDFEQKPKPTVGDRIRQGGNRALAEFAWKMFKVHGCSFCAFLETNDERKTVICKRPPDKTCIDGIEACLNSPAESEVESE